MTCWNNKDGYSFNRHAVTSVRWIKNGLDCYDREAKMKYIFKSKLNLIFKRLIHRKFKNKFWRFSFKTELKIQFFCRWTVYKKCLYKPLHMMRKNRIFYGLVFVKVQKPPFWHLILSNLESQTTSWEMTARTTPCLYRLVISFFKSSSQLVSWELHWSKWGIVYTDTLP